MKIFFFFDILQIEYYFMHICFSIKGNEAKSIPKISDIFIPEVS